MLARLPSFLVESVKWFVESRGQVGHVTRGVRQPGEPRACVHDRVQVGTVDDTIDLYVMPSVVTVHKLCCVGTYVCIYNLGGSGRSATLV